MFKYYISFKSNSELEQIESITRINNRWASCYILSAEWDKFYSKLTPEAPLLCKDVNYVFSDAKMYGEKLLASGGDDTQCFTMSNETELCEFRFLNPKICSF